MKRIAIIGMLGMLLTAAMSGCVGNAVTPAIVTQLQEGWSLDSGNSGSINISGMFNAYMNTYEHKSSKITDGMIFLAKMSNISFIDEVGMLNSLIDENLDGVVETLEKELNCQINVTKPVIESVTIDGYDVAEYAYTLSGSSGDGSNSISGKVVRAAWNCTDGAVVAVLGIAISHYKEGSAVDITPSPDQGET
ncbi:MAG: hypothetical protein PHH26_00005 [Candidatus Thermoplasmatota archaeon]|nr:hypothetical protein [Candidatus Thermoplasmatota archaeon]